MTQRPELNIVSIERPKRLYEFQQAIEALMNSDEFGRLSVAETLGVLQIVSISLWNRINEKQPLT